MKIVLCYVVVTHGRITEEYVSRFVTTYHEYPPEAEHDTVIIANGGPLTSNIAVLFSGINSRTLARSNDDGWDISGYIEAAKGPCAGYDMILCLGESNYFHRPGWLRRFVEAWGKYGPGMYGPYATNVIRAHLQTTAFCCHPRMLQTYPMPVRNRSDRYEFEHGQYSLWRRLAKVRTPVRLVTWDGEWEPRAFRFPANIIWRGDQTNCLMWCNHSDFYRDAPADRKSNWSRSADRDFK